MASCDIECTMREFPSLLCRATTSRSFSGTGSVGSPVKISKDRPTWIRSPLDSGSLVLDSLGVDERAVGAAQVFQDVAAWALSQFGMVSGHFVISAPADHCRVPGRVAAEASSIRSVFLDRVRESQRVMPCTRQAMVVRRRWSCPGPRRRPRISWRPSEFQIPSRAAKIGAAAMPAAPI